MRSVGRTIYIFCFVFVLIFTTLWLVERWLFENILEDIISKAEKNSIKISYERANTSGYPYDLVLHLRSVNIKFKNFFEITTPGVRIKVGLFFPLTQHFQVSFDNPTQGFFFEHYHQYASEALFSRDLSLKIFKGQADFFLKKMAVQTIKLFVDSLLITRDQMPIVELRPFKLHLTGVFEKGTPILYTYFYAHTRSSLDSYAAFDMTANFSISHYNVLFNTAIPAQAWHDKNGKIIIKKHQVQGKQLDFYENGAISLDDNLSLHGKLALKIQGITPFLKFFQKKFNFVFAESSLQQLMFMTNFSKNSEGYISIPVNLEDGTLFFWDISLFPLAWFQ